MNAAQAKKQQERTKRTLEMVLSITSDTSGVPEKWVFSNDEQQAKCLAEMMDATEDPTSAQRTLLVNKRIMAEPPPDLGDTPINWEEELSAFQKLPYPEYYLQPFHSVPGGWLSKSAAVMNRQAMQAIYVDTHPESCLGVRKELAKFITVAKPGATIVDFGSGDGDGAAAVAREFPDAKVIAVDASPFMIIVGRRQNRDAKNLEWKHALAEESGFADNSVDAVQIQLVLHECSDEGKMKIGKEACRILRPGGQLVLSDTPQNDLGHYRGFLEPHKDAWFKFVPADYFEACGFDYDGNETVIGGEENYTDKDATNNRTFTWVATKKQHTKAKL